MTNILVIDDDPQIRMMLSELLKRENYKVRVVSSGLEALKQFSREKPDLVITDVVISSAGSAARKWTWPV